MNQKGLALPLIILVVAAISAFFTIYFLSKSNLKSANAQTSSQTEKTEGPNNSINIPKIIKTDVQNLSNKVTSPSVQVYKTGDFSFEYSSDLTAKQDTEEDFNKRGAGDTVKAINDFRKNFTSYVQYEPGKFLDAVVVLDKDQKYDANPFTLWVFDNPDNLSIDQWYKNYWYYPFVWGDFTYTGKFTLAPHDEASVSGQMAKSGVIDYQPGKPTFIYLPKNNKMYLFRIIGDTGNKILQTFKFN